MNTRNDDIRPETDLFALSLGAGEGEILVQQLCAIATTMGFIAGHDSARDVTRPAFEQVMEVDACTIARAAAFIAASTLLSQHNWAKRGGVLKAVALVARAHLFADNVTLNRLSGFDLNRIGLTETLTSGRLTVDAEGFVTLRGKQDADDR